MTDPNNSIYEIKITGHLNKSWADWFDGFTFIHEADGSTALTGKISDQAALHGILKKIRDLGLPLLSINQIGPDLLKKE